MWTHWVSKWRVALSLCLYAWCNHPQIYQLTIYLTYYKTILNLESKYIYIYIIHNTVIPVASTSPFTIASQQQSAAKMRLIRRETTQGCVASINDFLSGGNLNVTLNSLNSVDKTWDKWTGTLSRKGLAFQAPLTSQWPAHSSEILCEWLHRRGKFSSPPDICCRAPPGDQTPPKHSPIVGEKHKKKSPSTGSTAPTNLPLSTPPWKWWPHWQTHSFPRSSQTQSQAPNAAHCPRQGHPHHACKRHGRQWLPADSGGVPGEMRWR